MERCSVYRESRDEAERHKWIESQHAGRDLGEVAIRQWVQQHWNGFLRARWLEHLEGKRYWIELDQDDYGLLQHHFHDKTHLLSLIIDHLKRSKENLDILLWAIDARHSVAEVREILETLDINSRRLAHQFDPL